MRLIPGRFVRGVVFILAVAFLGSGCVAFNSGKPETFTHVDRIVETASSSVRSEVLSANALFKKLGTEAAVGLDVVADEEFEKREHTETITVRKQKRLAFGLFPGAAEEYLMPSGALVSMASYSRSGRTNDRGAATYVKMVPYPASQLLGLLTCGFIHAFGTINSIFIAPFDSYDCAGHDHMEYGKEKPDGSFWDVSDSPKLLALKRFPSDEKKRIGVTTCFDSPAPGPAPFVSHSGLVGFHKYLAVFVDNPTIGPSTVVGTETKRRSALANGPYIAEFSIPALNHNDWKRVSTGGTQATFPLPAVERDCTVEAVVSFREDNSANGRNASDLTRQALAKVAGRQWKFDVALKGTSSQAAGHYRRPDPVPQHPSEKLFEVVTIKPLGEGKYLVRVEVKDKSKTFSILHLIKPEVYRLVREDFKLKNPEEPMQFVRESMRYETEEDGKILSFTGWVFSVRPVDDGWHYDSDTRRGWMRLRIMGGIPAVEAERWAHENIGEIVKYKNVALESGKPPPPGAQFRSLDENFSDGVLTVEFEAVQ